MNWLYLQIALFIPSVFELEGFVFGGFVTRTIGLIQNVSIGRFFPDCRILVISFHLLSSYGQDIDEIYDNLQPIYQYINVKNKDPPLK